MIVDTKKGVFRCGVCGKEYEIAMNLAAEHERQCIEKIENR